MNIITGLVSFFSEHMLIKLNSGKTQVPPPPLQYNVKIFSTIFYAPLFQIQFNIEFFSDTLFKIKMSCKVF